MDQHAAPPGTHGSTGRRLVVLGGGIAGVETALTLALGLPEDHVVLLARTPSLQLLPDLVYVPFGMDAKLIDIPLSELAEFGVQVQVCAVERVDVHACEVHTSAGPVAFDELVAAPGAVSREQGQHELRSLDDAIRLRQELTAAIERARSGEPVTVTICESSDDAWTAPACEMAVLLGAWTRAAGLGSRISTLLATSDHDPFEWFGPVGEVLVEQALRATGIQIATGVSAGRFDDLGGDVVVEFGALEARRIDGLPGWRPTGWYHASPSLRVAANVFVVGDALDLPYRSGFATAWHARTVLAELGGRVSDLGPEVDEIPVGSVEYQMDVADGVLRARMPRADRLGHPFLGHDAEIVVERSALPRKLVGLLVRDLILRNHLEQDDAARSYRAALVDAAAMAFPEPSESR